MDNFVRLTGRTRYAARVDRGGALWWKWEAVIIVLQVEEFYHSITYVPPDRDGMSNPDVLHQGYQWRDATLEDLATMGERQREPVMEVYRRGAGTNAPRPTQPVGPRSPVNQDQRSDDWPSIIRDRADAPPPGQATQRYSESFQNQRPQPFPQPPSTSGATD